MFFARELCCTSDVSSVGSSSLTLRLEHVCCDEGLTLETYRVKNIPYQRETRNSTESTCLVAIINASLEERFIREPLCGFLVFL